MAALSELRGKVAKALLGGNQSFNETDIDAYLNQGVNRIAAGIAVSPGTLSPPLPELYKQTSKDTVVISADTIAFVNGSPSTITDSDSGFLTAGFAAGMTIIVSGAGEDDNNTTYHNLATAAAGTLTLASGYSLTDETAGEDVVIKSPCVALPSDYGRGLHLVSSIDQDKRLELWDSYHKLLRRYPLLDKDGDVQIVAVKGSYLYYQPMPASAETLTLHYFRVPTEMTQDSDEPDGIPSHLQERLLVNYAVREMLEMIENASKGTTLRSAKFDQKFKEAMVDLMSHIGPEDIEPMYYDDEQDYIDDYGYL